jgi:hypothetical protein
MWLALLAGAVLLVGCGVFFAAQNLGRADQYASVASFFLALLTAIASVLSLARSRAKERTDDGGEQGSRPGHGRTVNYIQRVDAVQTGDGAYMNLNLTKIIEQPPTKRNRRSREPGPPSGLG